MIERLAGQLAGTARWFDVIETASSATPVSFRNNRLHTVTERSNRGLGVRVNVDGRTGFSYTNDPGVADETARRAVALSGFGEEEDFDLPASAGRSFEPYDGAVEAFDARAEIEAMEGAVAAILRRFPEATVDADISRSSGSVRIVNSRGLDAAYRGSSYTVSLSATLVLDDGSRIEAWESATSLAPAPADRLPEDVIRRLEDALVVRKVGSGRLPIIFTPKAFARMIGILTSVLSARAVWRGVSPFAGKIGETLFSGDFTLRDDPALPGSPYGYPFDDEGVTAIPKELVSRGRLERFVTDLRHAARLGIPAEGNGARGYSSLPSPSYSNIIIDAGTETREALMRGMGRGLLVDQLLGLGQSNTLTGEFSANLDLAYLVESGAIAGRVKDCMISGNLFTLLAGDITLSAERERRGSVLAPHVLFPTVNVTG